VCLHGQHDSLPAACARLSQPRVVPVEQIVLPHRYLGRAHVLIRGSPLRQTRRLRARRGRFGQKINRSHAHAHTHDSRTNHSHEHRASNGATTLDSRSRRRRPQADAQRCASNRCPADTGCLARENVQIR